MDAANGNSNTVPSGGSAKGNNDAAHGNHLIYQYSSYTPSASYQSITVPGRGPASGYQDPRFGFDGARSPNPWLDAPLFSDGQLRPVSSTTNTSSISGGNNTASRNQSYRPNSQFMVSSVLFSTCDSVIYHGLSAGGFVACSTNCISFFL